MSLNRLFMSFTASACAVAALIGCGGDDSVSKPGAPSAALTCGPGTYASNSECLPEAPAEGAESGEPPQLGDAGSGTDAADASASDATVDPLTDCLGDKDVFVLQGDVGNPLYEGTLRMEGSNGWRVEARGGAAGSTIAVHKGDWRAIFSSEQLGQPLGVATYIDAERAGTEEAHHAGLSIGKGDLECDAVRGHFTVLELEETSSDAATSTVANFVVSFEQQCDDGPKLRGCLHVTSP